ncbi:periplasmic protein [Legionella geestiana]|uniref:Periplasmic protein n=1 Tax=Legionella geestiana TaxID=45065 RepID=A0A0W0TK32_9GAMM|nr:hypothetical protein [Legionella geestiana]KTC95869.1 periplasmic protein [Legionella geestiana]QBS13280.1 hypothetical protein E4T54_11290 [Legionella geestiana]QDQ40870.1 hypothetical protein E3226_010900 [Legionella geestiana]STX54193.1 periplasmic protein [Legionella geestiana]
MFRTAFWCLMFIPLRALAFDCYVTLVKDNCWTNYDVTVTVTDSATGNAVLTLTAPKGQTFGRGTFQCQAEQTLAFSAQFSPVFWQSDAGKTWRGIRTLSLPKAPKPGELAWNLPICFSSAFSGVPLPPGASGNCACDFGSVPAIVIPAKSGG